MAYHSSMLNKSRGPTPATMFARIGQDRFEEIHRYLIDQCGFVGGFPAWLVPLIGTIVLSPGDQVDDTGIICHPHHFEKQAEKALQLNGLWRTIKAQIGNMVNATFLRVNQLLQRVIQIRVHLQSPLYALLSSVESNSGLHAYANCNIIRAYVCHLTHQDRCRIHLPGENDEYDRSLWIQVLATKYLKMVHAVGLDVFNTPGLEYILRWDVPIPVAFSYHVSNGPASHPILGSIVTASEDFYRPTLRPLQFRFALRSRRSV